MDLSAPRDAGPCCMTPSRTRYSDSSPFIVYKLALTDYTIDGKVHDYLGNRKDGKVIDTSRS